MKTMKNTTERIFALGGNHRGDHSFLLELYRNNPLSPTFWNACIENNPGAFIPTKNPTEIDDLLDRARAAMSRMEPA